MSWGNVIHIYSTRAHDQMYVVLWSTDTDPMSVQGPLTTADIDALVRTKQVIDDVRARELFGQMVARGDLVLTAVL